MSINASFMHLKVKRYVHAVDLKKVLIYRVIVMSRDKKQYSINCAVLLYVVTFIAATLCSWCLSIGHTFTFMISFTHCMKVYVCF